MEINTINKSKRPIDPNNNHRVAVVIVREAVVIGRKKYRIQGNTNVCLEFIECRFKARGKD